MNEFFIELYSNEIPSNLQDEVVDNFKNHIENLLKDFDILTKDTKIEIYYTNRRLIFYANNLKDEGFIQDERILGPNTNSPQNEIDEFLEAFKIDSIDKLMIVDKVYIFELKGKFENSKKILEDNLEYYLYKVSFNTPDTIRWFGSSTNIQWVAPLLNITSLWNNELVSFTFFDIKSTNKTFSNKINLNYGDGIVVNNFQDYKTKMIENLVIFNQDERLKLIEKSILEIEKTNSLFVCGFDIIVCERKALFNKLSKIAEFPTIFICDFDKYFLNLPEKTISFVINKNNNFLVLRDKLSGELTNKFVLVLDGNFKDVTNILNNIKKEINLEFSMIKTEVESFLDETIEEKNLKLKTTSQNIYIGNLYQKSKRVEDLSRFVSVWIPHCNLVTVESISKLYKMDVHTRIVRENPDLEGSLISFYTKKNDYPNEVSLALMEYGKPETFTDSIPFTPAGKALAIADKIDNITSVLITKIENTSSKDPFGVRKDVAAVIKIIFESEINIPLDLLIHRSIGLFRTSLYKKNSGQKFNIKKQINIVYNTVLNLFITRYTRFLLDKKFDINIVKGIILSAKNNKNKFDLKKIYEKVIFITEYKKNNADIFNQVIKFYKRLNNILIGYETSGIKAVFITKTFKFNLGSIEKSIFTEFKKNRKLLKRYEKNNDFENCINLLNKFSILLNNYFETTKIKTDNLKETNKRLVLLYKIKSMFDSFINFQI